MDDQKAEFDTVSLTSNYKSMRAGQKAALLFKIGGDEPCLRKYDLLGTGRLPKQDPTGYRDEQNYLDKNNEVIYRFAVGRATNEWDTLPVSYKKIIFTDTRKTGAYVNFGGRKPITLTWRIPVEVYGRMRDIESRLQDRNVDIVLWMRAKDPTTHKDPTLIASLADVNAHRTTYASAHFHAACHAVHQMREAQLKESCQPVGANNGNREELNKRIPCSLSDCTGRGSLTCREPDCKQRACGRICLTLHYTGNHEGIPLPLYADVPWCYNPSCNHPGTKLCMDCKTAQYCSRKCQKADWKVHKPLCIAMCNKS
jgi:hypothetical protein